MFKKLIMIVGVIFIFLIGGLYGYDWTHNHTEPAYSNMNGDNKPFVIKQNKEVIDTYSNKEEAIKQSKELPRSVVIDTKEEDKWIYSNLQPYMIVTGDTIHDFENFSSATRYAEKNDYKYIYYKDPKTIIWKQGTLKDEHHIENVPHIKQYPELPRGCEVTSLAMLFEYYNKPISKLELADKIKKDVTPYSVDEKGRIHYGNPYEGFVGNIYDMKEYGYGVYHGPIADLAEQYFPEKIIDATGSEFEDILRLIEQNIPILVIINGSFKKLPDKEFEIWHTPTDIVKVTKRMHAVVITGYTQQHIIINDPLKNSGDKKVNRKNFIEAWEQMGHQAVGIIP